MTIILVSALVLPIINIDWTGAGNKDAVAESALNGYSIPLATIAPEDCSLKSSYKEEWDLIVCEHFTENTDLWVGSSGGTTVTLDDGSYKVDNINLVERVDSSGYTVPILVGAAENMMMSVTGSMDCLEGECAWGVFMRSKFDEIVHIFMIDEVGKFSFTGLSSEETSQSLGNIQTDNHSAIQPDDENTITAVAEGKQMMLYVNGQLLVTHDAFDAENPAFGLIVWGGPSSRAVNRFESVMVRRN